MNPAPKMKTPTLMQVRQPLEEISRRDNAAGKYAAEQAHHLEDAVDGRRYARRIRGMGETRSTREITTPAMLQLWVGGMRNTINYATGSSTKVISPIAP